jgi:hypothetical protein
LILSVLTLSVLVNIGQFIELTVIVPLIKVSISPFSLVTVSFMFVVGATYATIVIFNIAVVLPPLSSVTVYL